MSKVTTTHEVSSGPRREAEKISAVEQRLKKNVGAIHSSGNLTLVQRKLANVLLYSAYDTLLTKRTHTIPVSIMCAMLGWEDSKRIDHLKEAILALQKTTVQFNLRDDGKETWESMSMLSYAQIRGGLCTWRYDEALAEKLYDPAMYALINIKIQRQLDSAYALNLYENLYRYRNTDSGSSGEWSLEFFREIIGATASYYDDYRELNRKIIKPSIEKINRDTDIIIEKVEKITKSRFVVGLKFIVREKTQVEKDKMPATIEGTSPKDGIDAFAEIRNSEAFKLLLKHGISERLANQWIEEKGEKNVIDLVAYTENKDAKGAIKTNTGAYITSLVKQGAEVGESLYEQEKRETAIKVKAIDEEAKYQTELAENKTKEMDMAIWASFNAMEKGTEKTAIIDAVMSNTNSYAKKEYAKNGTSGMLVKSTFISYLKKNPHLLAAHGQNQRQNEQQH